METTKLDSSQIGLFIEEARPHVTKYRNRDGLAFIGGSREAQLLRSLNADVEEYKHHLPGKVGNSNLHNAVTFAFRIYRAYDPFSSEEDQKIYDEARELVTYVLGQTRSQEGLAAESPGQYVWLVIATLMAVAGVDNTTARQAAAGYDSIGKARDAGIGGVETAVGAHTPIHVEAEKVAGTMPHSGALVRIGAVAKGDFYPEELVKIRDEVKNLFPTYNEEAVKLMVTAAFATAMLDKGSAAHAFEFKFTK